jgi:hypothetical protein
LLAALYADVEASAAFVPNVVPAAAVSLPGAVAAA